MAKKKKVLIVIFTSVLVVAWMFCLFIVSNMMIGGKVVEAPEQLAGYTILTRKQVEEDRNLAIEYVENIHPYFVLEEDLSTYEVAKQKYIDATKSEMTVSEFRVVTAEYLCFFGDGHTRLHWAEEAYMDLKTVYQDGKSYLVEADEITDIYIEEIGGVEIASIYELICKIFPMENDIMKALFLEKYITGRNVLELAGAEIADKQVSVTFSDGRKEMYSLSKTEHTYNYDGNRWYEDGDIFVIDFNTCVVDDTLEEIVSVLEDKMDQGCSKVIIDVRGNGGGNSKACSKLLDAMDITAPEYDVVIRFSKEAKSQNGYMRSNGIKTYKGSDKSVKNDEVSLVVLSDRETFSSATMLCVWVRDGRLGTIIGEPSANMPNSYGDIIYFSLPNSHLYAWASHKKFIRPDETNEERMLIPDVRVGSEEAYEEAVKYLHAK